MTETISTHLSDLLGGAIAGYPGCECPSLRLDKYVRLFGENEGAGKRRELEALCSCRAVHPAPMPDLSTFPGAVPIVARLRSRLIVNQAGGIRENAGLCLHPHSGVPYIPGSAVKGIACHAAWCECNEGTDETKKAVLDAERSRIFGKMTDSGLVAFLPAFPIDAAPLAVDIVNCHHSDYYAGRQPVATDDEQPIPNYFPAVDAGPRFLFALVPLRGCNADDLVLAQRWLRSALSIHGAGAKTAAGYGWFDCDEKLTEDWRTAREDEKRRAVAEKRKLDFAQRIEMFMSMSDDELKSHAKAVRGLKQELTDFDDQEFFNRHIHSINGIVNRLPPTSPLDELRSRWEQMTDKARLGEIKGFPRERNEERKKNIVLLLREPSGVGHDLWQAIRAGQRGDIAKGADAIRIYCTQTLKLPRMP